MSIPISVDICNKSNSSTGAKFYRILFHDIKCVLGSLFSEDTGQVGSKWTALHSDWSVWSCDQGKIFLCQLSNLTLMMVGYSPAIGM